MLEFYRVKAELVRDEQVIGWTTDNFILTREVPQDEVVELTWENIQKMRTAYCLEWLIDIWTFKKGRVIYFVNWEPFMKMYKPIKEKDGEVGMQLRLTYKKIDPSIKFVLDWQKGSQAIEYLNEHGLKLI